MDKQRKIIKKTKHNKEDKNDEQHRPLQKNWGLSQGSYEGLEVPASYKTPTCYPPVCLSSGRENACLEKLRTFENIMYGGFPPALL